MAISKICNYSIQGSPNSTPRPKEASATLNHPSRTSWPIVGSLLSPCVVRRIQIWGNTMFRSCSLLTESSSKPVGLMTLSLTRVGTRNCCESKISQSCHGPTLAKKTLFRAKMLLQAWVYRVMDPRYPKILMKPSCNWSTSWLSPKKSWVIWSVKSAKWLELRPSWPKICKKSALTQPMPLMLI